MTIPWALHMDSRGSERYHCPWERGWVGTGKEGDEMNNEQRK